MKIYTTTGDQGETSLFGGKRVPKDALRIEAYGTVDELNSSLGVARSLKPAKELDEILEILQNDLFVLGADLATPVEKQNGIVERIRQEHITRIEKIIDSVEARLTPLSSFILPCGSQVAAQLHLARTICRRAERCVVKLSREERTESHCVMYLNRISDLLFVLARRANQIDGVEETPWKASKK
jgi:cob(I)alamin adenosyltransferase